MSGIPAEIAKLFDRYDRQARLYPAVIAFSPIIYSTILLFPDVVSSVSHAAATALISMCVLFMLANLSRAQGKRVEVRLLDKWDGWPTTALLRYRDERIDRNTKARYHTALKALAKDLIFPSREDEVEDPKSADDVYRSATKKLIEARRGDKYGRILDENISYGFRRNLLGLKVIAVITLSVAILLTMLGCWIEIDWPPTLGGIAKAVKHYPHLPVLLGVDIIFLGIWLVAVNDDFVSQAAVSYAEALFRSLEK